MMNLLRRRFVNLVAENCTSGECSLHRLDVSQHLFYPSTAEAEAAPKPTVFRLPLPPATLNFQPAVAGNMEHHVFGLANPGVSESRILWRSQEGNTFVFDADSRTAWSMPGGLHYMGRDPIVISAPVPVAAADDDDREQEDLFVMCSNNAYPGFQVLRFEFDNSKPTKRAFCPRTLIAAYPPWGWNRLPPPPLPEGSDIYSHAVLDDGRVICVSAAATPFDSGGTYLFDTVRREWLPQATSDWHMPFFGAPQYVPGLNLWLGVSWSAAGDEDGDGDRHHLCASSDLGAVAAAAAMGVDRPSVTVTHHWKQAGLETPVGWNTVSAQLVDLGDGRFCVAKIMDEPGCDEYAEYQYSGGRTAALLTGVEMVRGAGDRCSSSNPSSWSSSSEGEGFRMVVHKSLRHIFCRESINWVL